MGHNVAMKLLKYMKIEKININNSKVLIMGFAFKENCKDVRNSQVYDIYLKLLEKKCNVDVYDPIADSGNSLNYYNLKFTNKLNSKFYDAIIISVAHDIFIKMGINKIKKLLKLNGIIFDVKGIFNNKKIDSTLKKL